MLDHQNIFRCPNIMYRLTERHFHLKAELKKQCELNYSNANYWGF